MNTAKYAKKFIWFATIILLFVVTIQVIIIVPLIYHEILRLINNLEGELYDGMDFT